MSDPEPFLSEPQRLTILPIIHNDIWKHYKTQLACFWVAQEIDWSKDRDQWNTLLNDNERTFIRSILAFFATSDSVVAMNIMNSFVKDCPVLEAQTCYTYQAAIEGIHAEVYSLAIDVYITDPQERDDMFNNFGNIPSVRHKIEWAQKWSLHGENASASFARRLAAYAIVEGLFFSGAFCAIYWIKQRNLLPGLTKSNEFIARDEGQHTEFACILYNKLTHTRLPESEAHDIFRDAVAVETEFINESVPCRMIGMNPALMTQYIEYVADGLLSKLGYATIYGSQNPFDFMDYCGMEGRSNFFEERVSLYQRADVLNKDASFEASGGMAIYTEDF